MKIKLLSSFLFGCLSLTVVIPSFGQLWTTKNIENFSGTSSNSQLWGGSLKNVNGNPAIAYFDGAHNNLMFIRAKDTDGTIWDDPQVLDWQGHVGGEIIMEVVNGKPAVLYLDFTQSVIKYIIAKDSDGLNWNSPTIIEKSGLANFEGSLRVINGKPAVTYSIGSTGPENNLRYCQALDADGKEWSEPIDIEYQGFSVFGTSLETVNGFPAIAYGDYKNYIMKFVMASDVDGKTWSTPVAIDTVGNIVNCILREFGGKPAMIYWNLKRGQLCVRLSKDEAGTTWEEPTLLDSLETSGKSYPSAMIIDGLPTIVYHDFIKHSLKYIRSKDVAGKEWESPMIVDSVGNTGYGPSLEVINGKPAISYSSTISGKIKFIQAKDTSGAIWNDPITFEETGSCGQMISGATINGLPSVVYTNSGIVFAQATDSIGMSWKKSVVLDNKANPYRTSLKLVGGKPGVCYFDQGVLKYLRSKDTTGNDWPTSTIISGNVGFFGGLEDVSGNPAVVYSSAWNNKIVYARADNADGNIWTLQKMFDEEDQGYLGSQSLKIVNGNPAICYTNYFMQLVLKRSADVTGSVWNSSTIIDRDIYTSYVSFEIVNGYPAVAYYDNKNQNLKFVTATDSDGLNWNKPMVIDSVGDVGIYPSIKVIEGYPAIAYLDESNHLIKFVRALDEKGQSWNSPEVIADVSPLYGYDDSWHYGTGISLMQSLKGAGIAYYNIGEQFPYFAYGRNCKIPVAPEILLADTSICQYDSIALQFTGGPLFDAERWQWREGSVNGPLVSTNNNLVYISPQGTTKYFVHGEGGCVVQSDADSVTVTVRSRPLTPTITVDSTTTILKTTGGLFYEWYLNGVALGVTNDSILVPTTTGYYTVRSVYEGCSSEFSDSIEFALSISTYPNPATTQLTVTIPEESVNLETYIEITNLQGGIQNTLVSTGNQTINIDISDYPGGEYILRITVGGITKTIKFLKV